MNLAAVVFDLDGTLVDSRPDIATAMNRIRSELGLAALSLADVGGMMGEGSRNLVRRALSRGLPAMAAMDADRFERSHARFLEQYAVVCTAETRPYEGVQELLDGCARRWPLALLTNKPIAMTRALVEALRWGRFFRAVVGGDSLPYRKPDGRGLLEVAAALGAAPETTLLVGDSRIDAETARAAGSQFVWVKWGYAVAEDRPGLADGNSARSPAALAAWLEALPQ
ncbi:MAG: HAD-IA family hydrolase [Thermoanaerobaculia bacterium]